VARASNNGVISSDDLYYCLLPQCEALRVCCSGFPIATIPSGKRHVLKELNAGWKTGSPTVLMCCFSFVIILFAYLFIYIFIIFIYFVLRQTTTGQSRILSFGPDQLKCSSSLQLYDAVCNFLSIALA